VSGHATGRSDGGDIVVEVSDLWTDGQVGSPKDALAGAGTRPVYDAGASVTSRMDYGGDLCRFADLLQEALDWSAGLEPAFRTGKLGSEIATQVFSPERLYILLERKGLDSQRLRFLKNGVELHPNEYLSRTNEGDQSRLLDLERISEHLDAGCTIVLDRLETMDPGLEEACRSLQWWLGAQVEVNAYLTTGQTFGFSRHADDHHILVIQILGEKNWVINGISNNFPRAQGAAVANDLVWEGLMRPGDVLHIPPGQLHRAFRSERGASLHLTFGITTPTAGDWVRWLASHTDGPDEPEPGLAALWNEATSPALTDLLATLVQAFSPARFLLESVASRTPVRHIFSAAVSPRPESILCVTNFPPLVVKRSDGIIDVIARGRRILLRSNALPAVRAFVSGYPTRIDSFPGIAAADARLVADVLLKEGICIEHSSALAAGFFPSTIGARNPGTVD
jgi:Cupin superfamily protein